ncbi:MAG: gamma-glutamyltransferase [Gammaproteobacteria bacterium]|nr:gamma-glutamyltransferase [Gammaproteobacteria bacterium]
MRKYVSLILLLGLAACSVEPTDTSADDAASPWPHGAMVSAANPYAAQAAADMLQAGGHAVDAAIAAHAVLGLVEPQSSGLGGGAFMLVYQQTDDSIVAYDGRETAPAAATEDMFVVDGEPLPYLKAWQSGISVGVPGVIALYHDTHAEHGRLDLATVLAPAIELAREGFVVSPRLADFLVRLREYIRLDENPDTAGYFYPDGEPLPEGFVRSNEAYAQTLEDFISKGPAAFYRGDLAHEIVAAARAEPLPGTLSLEDLVNYRVERREALCAPVPPQRICAMPPPSSGLAQIMILGLYDRIAADLASDTETARWSAFVDAQRLAYADRDHYVADADFVDVPVNDLISPRYLDARADQRSEPAAAPATGDPGAVLRGEPLLGRWAADSTQPMPSTSHLSVIDSDGNAVSLTASVESVFGSSRWAGGFLLNNQLTDFARDPSATDTSAANRVEPGKRPRSSMSPTMVFDGNGRLQMITGSPGGNSIVAYVAKSIVGALRWDLSAQQAIDLPNVVARGREVRVETGVPGGSELADALADQGYPVEEREGENSGLHVLLVTDDGVTGGADPRREGQVIPVR